jgi:hypothetical protein
VEGQRASTTFCCCYTCCFLFCFVNFNITIFLFLFLFSSLSLLFLCYNPFFSLPTTLSATSHLLFSLFSPTLPLLSFPNLTPHSLPLSPTHSPPAD